MLVVGTLLASSTFFDGFFPWKTRGAFEGTQKKQAHTALSTHGKNQLCNDVVLVIFLPTFSPFMSLRASLVYCFCVYLLLYYVHQGLKGRKAHRKNEFLNILIVCEKIHPDLFTRSKRRAHNLYTHIYRPRTDIFIIFSFFLSREKRETGSNNAFGGINGIDIVLML